MKKSYKEFNGIMLYKCARCNEWLPGEHFYNMKKGRGKFCYCITCDSVRKSEYNSKIKRKILIENYWSKHKEKLFFCTKCAADKTFDDYFFTFSNKKITCSCKKCQTENTKKYLLNRKLERGY